MGNFLRAFAHSSPTFRRHQRSPDARRQVLPGNGSSASNRSRPSALGRPALQASASQPFGGKIADIDDGNAVHTDVTDVDCCGRAVGIAPVPRATILNHKLLKSDMARPADASPALPWEYRNADRSEGVLKVAPSASSDRMYAAAKERYSGNTSSGIFHRSSCRYYNCKRWHGAFLQPQCGNTGGVQTLQDMQTMMLASKQGQEHNFAI